MLNDKHLIWLRGLTARVKRIPGAVLVLDQLRKAFAHRITAVTVHDFDGGMTAKLYLNEHMQSQIFWYGYYSRDVVMLLDRLLEPGMVVMDVGANVGEITMAAARRVGPYGAVYAFEPMTQLFGHLIEHVEANKLLQVVPIRKGLSDSSGSAEVYAAASTFHDGTENRGLGTLYRSDRRSIPVETIDLDTIDLFTHERGVARIDLIKIDVEGAELPVLKGALEALKRFLPYLIVEIQKEMPRQAGYEAADILALLEPLGYRFYLIGRKAVLKEVTASGLGSFQNVLCVPRTRQLNAR